ncbi:MAG: DUF2656 domain-containing protein [Cyanobacteria bacterium P01_E01_bin.35]
MSDKSTGRMLLSHNYNLSNNQLPALTREEFAQIFIEGLQEKPSIKCSLINNPHWVVEILFPKADFDAQTIGQMCGAILTSNRQSQLADSSLSTDTLILGGKKTTPVTSASPTSLQTGEWGVDVVETPQATAFLAAINWDAMTANKPSDGIFKIEFIES